MIIFKTAIKRIFKSKIKLVILLIMPLFFILMYATQSESTMIIGIVDQDNSTLSKKLIGSLKEFDKIKVMLLEEKELHDKAVSYQTEYSIIIRSGFEEKLITGKNPEVEEFYILEKEKLFYTKMFIDNYINIMKLISSGVEHDKTRFDAALKEYDKDKLVLTNESGAGKKIPQSRLAMGFLIQFMLYTSVITSGLILEDKNSGVFYRVFYAPVSIKDYLLQNLGAFLIIGIMQAIIILTLVKNIFGLELGNHPLNMYALFIVFSMVCISLGLFIVSLFKKPIYAYSLVFFITTPLVMLGSCYWPKEVMSDTMNKIAQFLPTSWIMNGVDKLLLEGSGLKDVTLEIFILLIFSGIFMAAGLFKKIDVSK